MKARIGDVQTLLGITGLLVVGHSGKSIAQRLDPTTQAKSNPVAPQSCEHALDTLVHNSSLPTSRKAGLTAVLEAQDDEQVTFGLFSEANQNIALGWIRIDWSRKQLLDLTNDIEAPVRLAFRSQDWTRATACLRGMPTAP